MTLNCYKIINLSSRDPAVRAMQNDCTDECSLVYGMCVCVYLCLCSCVSTMCLPPFSFY